GPECGAVDGIDAAQEPLPWEAAGGAASFLTTFAIVLAHPRELGRQIWRPAPIDGRAAFAFQRICVWIATASLAPIAVVALIAAYGFQQAMWCMPVLTASTFFTLRLFAQQPSRFVS